MTTASGRAIAWIALLTWMGLIFAASHQSADELVTFGSFDLALKKSGHFVAYAILGLLAVSAMERRSWALLVALLYAVSDEYHQTFVPGRTGIWSDVLIDAAGAVFAVFAQGVWRRTRQ